MKLLKLLPLLLMFTFFNSNTHAAQNCDEIKGNIVGKLFCKAKASRSGSTAMSSTTSTTSQATNEKKGILSKIWQRPEWTKRKKKN